MKPCLILGAGGHGRVLLDELLLLETPVYGFLDPDPVLQGQDLWGIPVLGPEEEIRRWDPDAVLLVNGLGSTGNTNSRSALFLRWQERGYRFASVVSSWARVSPRALLAEGVQILKGAVVQCGVRVEENAVVNTGAVVDHDCLVGAHAHLAPRVVLSGNVRVGEGAHVGTGASVIQGRVIGEGALVAAGATVVRDVVAGTWVAGVPACPMKKCNERNRRHENER